MLTQKEHQTFEYIQAFIKAHDYSPTTSEIAAGIKIKSRGVVYRYLKSLEEEGVIRLLPGKRRNIQLVSKNNPGVISIEGKIAAGPPLEVFENRQSLNVNQLIEGRFLLQVVGDSMLGDNINDGDLILCQRQESYREDQILVVVIDEQEAALKRVQRKGGGRVALISSNPEFAPREFNQDRVKIQGAYKGLIRLNS
jgi:repressor LexA